jgi:hypothetical protein
MSDLKPCTICGGHLLLRTDHTIEIKGAETILEEYLRDIHAERNRLREALTSIAYMRPSKQYIKPGSIIERMERIALDALAGASS